MGHSATIVKRENTKGQTTYSVVVYLGSEVVIGEDGNPKRKQKQKWHSGLRTKKEAQEKRNQILREMDTGSYVEPSKELFGRYLQQWLAGKGEIRVNTKRLYSRIIDLHILPSKLGQIPLCELVPGDFRSYYATARKSGRKDEEGGLSNKSLRIQHAIMRMALQQAVDDKHLREIPMGRKDAPKMEERSVSTLTREESKRVLEAAEGERLYIPVILGLQCGLRVGEIASLKWENIDWERKCLVVQGTQDQVTLETKTTKTRSSTRKVYLGSDVLSALRRHKGLQAAERLQQGPLWEDNNLVCPTYQGKPWRATTITHLWYSLLDRLGLERRSFHTLRHTHATLLLGQGMNPKMVSLRLGHSDVAFTLKTYCHPDLEDQAAAAAFMDALLREA